jgi:hypothetical protein
MNLAFLLVAAEEYMDSSMMIVVDVCTGVAVLTHYLVLTSLMWMLVEAINMYQLLITVFATSETKFMCKRMLCAWGECQNCNYLLFVYLTQHTRFLPERPALRSLCSIFPV